MCDYHNTFQNVDNGVDFLKSNLGFNLRNSLEVISLLKARTVDPEEFLADLGFAEPDMRSRIPDRFLQGQSKAHGIDVDGFRRSLDQDDLYASLVRMCPRLVSWKSVEGHSFITRENHKGEGHVLIINLRNGN